MYRGMQVIRQLTSGFCVVAVALCISGCEEKPRSRTRPPGPEALIGSQAPEIADDDLLGTTVKLSEYRGRIVVLSFWAEY